MKKILFIFIMSMFMISLVSAAEPSFRVKQNSPYDIKVSCENAGGFCSASSTCNLTVNTPDSDILINNVAMENLNNGYFNFSITENHTILLGEYTARAGCSDGTLNATTTFIYEVTPTGLGDIFDFYLIILIASAVIIIFGFWISDPWVVMFGTFGLYFVGIFIIRFGIVGLRDNAYTFSIGLVLIGIASYISIKIGIELLDGLR